MRSKINQYVCEYGCLIHTIDVDDGVTPFFIKCVRKPDSNRPIAKKFLDKNGECIGTASSRFYPREPLPSNVEITHEWYRPDSEDNLTASEIDHFKNGGLFLRERTDKNPVFHKDEE